MSGHSKWSTIKRQKGTTDAKRGLVFTKIGNQISIAVREGGGADPQSNFKLRLVIEKARSANMPKDNIARAVEKGLGKGSEANLESAVYEGFGPGGVAVIVETISDNRTRTGAELRNLFDKHGGSLGGPGTVSYMFKRIGEIEVPKTAGSYDSMVEKALEAEAEDVEENDESFSIYTKPEDLHKVKDKLEASGLSVSSAELLYKPNKETMQVLDAEKQTQLEQFLELVEEMDDVQEVFVNV